MKIERKMINFFGNFDVDWLHGNIDDVIESLKELKKSNEEYEEAGPVCIDITFSHEEGIEAEYYFRYREPEDRAVARIAREKKFKMTKEEREREEYIRLRAIYSTERGAL